MLSINGQDVLLGVKVGGTWSVLSGTWIIPAFTLGGALDANSQNLTSVNLISGVAGFTMYSTVDDTSLAWRGGTNTLGSGARLVIFGKDHAQTGRFDLITPNAAGDGDVTRLIVSGKAAIAVASWVNVAHTGLKLSGLLDVAGQFVTFLERAAPGAGAVNEARIYAVVGGDTLTDLSAVFQDGSIDNFATETTPDNSPLFITPSRTKLGIELRKDHPGVVRIVAIFPSGEEFDLKHHEYHDPVKIAANKGAEGSLPSNWLIEDATQRAARLEVERIAALPKAEVVE